MKVWAWVIAWYAGFQFVLAYTDSPGMALAGLVILAGFYSLVQLGIALAFDR